MYRKEFVRLVAEKMRENDIRKPISIPRHVFHISDDEGNKKDFYVKKADKGVLFTADDVNAIVEACLCVIGDSLKRGEKITISGFGTLGLSYHKPKRIVDFTTGEDLIVSGRYLPRFTYGEDLRMCAKVYELSLVDNTEDDKVLICHEEDGGE